MSNASVNGAAASGAPRRKTLADQLDRLDGVIDDLSVGLNEAVAHVVQQAVTQAVGQAVEAVLKAVLSNPELLARLAPPAPQPAQPPPPAPAQRKPGLGARLAAGVRRCGAKLAAGVKWVASAACGAARRAFAAVKSRVGGACRSVAGSAARAFAVLTLAVALARHFRRPLAASAGVGLVVGLGAYLAGPVVGALVSGFAGAGLALAAMVLRHAWRMVVPAGPAGTP